MRASGDGFRCASFVCSGTHIPSGDNAPTSNAFELGQVCRHPVRVLIFSRRGSQTVADACERMARRIPKSGGSLLQDLKAAARAAARATRDVLRRSGVRPLSFQEREEMRRQDDADQAAAARSVRAQRSTPLGNAMHL